MKWGTQKVPIRNLRGISYPLEGRNKSEVKTEKHIAWKSSQKNHDTDAQRNAGLDRVVGRHEWGIRVSKDKQSF